MQHNTTTDGLKNLQITYNILNLPQSVTQSGTTKATYGWFADGTKYSVLDAQGNGYYYIGSLIYSSTEGTTALESTDFSGGRIVMNGSAQTIHYHHKDHLGSVRAVTDTNGTVIEQNAYYPFGGRHTFGQTYTQTSANRYKFNGKELQTTGNIGLLDYGARMYDTKTARWLVQDPLAEKYYPFSPYNYCVNNPVMFVDPDGKDIWEIDGQGRIINRITDTTQDAFYIVNKDSDGNYQRVYNTDENGNKVYTSISFDFKTIESQKNITYSPDGKNTDIIDIYRVRGDDNGMKLFRFFSDNITNSPSMVEFSLAQTGIKGNTGLNFVTTSHENSRETGMSQLIMGQLQNGYTIRNLVHSHHTNVGLDYNDLEFASQVTEIMLNNKLLVPDFMIYHSVLKVFINF